jgi:starch phosphorylase
LQQEIVLGIGGVRVLRALKINPVVWHANEGHTAFMMLERINEQQAAGASFAEAIARVRATTVFTTHTPVQAGHDVFQTYQMKSFFDRYCESCRIDEPDFFRLGQDGSGEHLFNMTAFALRTTNQHNAVSQLHGKVARRMWNVLWPEVAEEQVPILHVTNGIHVPTWIAPELNRLFTRYLGKGWLKEQDDPKLWEKVMDIPDEEFWLVHQLLKRKLMGVMREAGRSRWVKNNMVAGQLPALGVMLDPDVLTIGFTRRFAEYKRPTLIFRDLERLKKIINNSMHPVQIILAGKSHPADFPSKQLLHEVYSMATDKAFQGRIAFVEDYDMHLAHYLVQGVDIWLNTPRRLQEACGTSGMKAALNGVLHMSVRDGWWYEAYNGANGWVINNDLVASRPEEQDEADAPEIYRLLEQEIVPLFYNRDRSGVPHGWIDKVKRSISSIAPAFSARRMLKEYAGLMYRPADQPPGSPMLKI